MESCPESLHDLLRLDTEVKDSGENLSAGERQIGVFSAARHSSGLTTAVALLRAMNEESKVLVLDEPTSNVDPLTDDLIQAILQTRFQGVTVLCIAHRLSTIGGFDRVLVMEAGRVAEVIPRADARCRR